MSRPRDWDRSVDAVRLQQRLVAEGAQYFREAIDVYGGSSAEHRQEIADWILSEISLAFTYRFRIDHLDVGKEISRVVARLLEGEENPEISVTLLNVLILLREAAREVAEEFRPLIRSQHKYVRMAAANLLGEALPPNMELAQLLWDMYLNEEREVKYGATAGLMRQIVAMPLTFLHELEARRKVEKEKKLKERLLYMIQQLRKK